MKLAGRSVPAAAAKPVRDVRTVIKTIPPPALAAGIVFIILLIVCITLMSGGRSGGPGVRAASGTRVPQSMASRVREPARQPAPETDESESSPNALKVYTFQSSEAPVTSHQAQTPAPAPKRKPEVAPARIANTIPELTIVPERKAAKPAKPEKKAASTEPASDENAPAKAPEKQTGSSLLALALQYHDQGLNADAVDTINRAKALFQADVDAGKNVESAKRGVNLATKYAAVWGQPSEGSSE
jgi:hypothetical protein